MDTAEQTETKPVEELIIERAKLSYARLPMLEVVFDRFALTFAPELKTYLGAMTDVTLKAVEYLSCQDAVNELPDPSLVAVTDVEGWAGPLAVVLRPDLLFAVLEITFGGRTVQGGERTTRAFTAIEKRIGQRLCEVALDGLKSAFAKVSPVEFEVSHLETNPKALLLGPPTSACVRVVLEIEAEDRKGEMIFVLPNTAFEPVNHILSQNFTGGQLGGDTGWRNKMTGMLEHTSINVTAIMGESTLNMRDVLAWVPGTLLDFGMQAQDDITLACSGKHVAKAEVGRKRNGKVALKLTEKLYDEEELTNVLGY